MAKYGKFDPRNKKRSKDKYRSEKTRIKPVNKKSVRVKEYEQIKTA